MPLWYSSALDEHKAVRSSAGVFDVSHMGRFHLSGWKAGEVLSSLFSRDPRKMSPGTSGYALACNERGGIDDDLIVYRLSVSRYMVICNASNAETIGRRLDIAAKAARTEIEALRDESVLLAIQGPEASWLLSQVLEMDLEIIPRHECRDFTLEEVPYFFARTGYTGEDGFEVMTDPDTAARVFDKLIEAGVKPCGLAARDSLRLEAALPLHGHEITPETTPWEAGLGWAVDLEHDFTGKAALIAAKGQQKRRLVCLVADEQAILRAGCEVHTEAGKVGEVTSGGFSPVLDRSIALAYLPLDLASIGQALTVELRGRQVACHVVKRPFYKAEPGATGGKS